MQLFEQESKKFFNQLDKYKKMVLSTSLNDKVTSRMMSIIILDNSFYFQTDITFRKYKQIQNNPNVALCIDNIQIEGICEQFGSPFENATFCKLYHQYFPNSYDKYTNIKNERLFVVKPVYIQKWIYKNGEPFIEIFDFKSRNYIKKEYKG